MRTVEKRTQVRRRVFLQGAAALPVISSAGASLVAGATISPSAAWATEATALKPNTMATLVLMSRDTYPHDQIPDIFYVNAVKPFDAKAAKSADVATIFEDGVSGLDAKAHEAHGVAYLQVPDESDRVVILEAIQHTPFFEQVRSGLVVSLYNQPEIWHRFGYEGSSAEHGGYLHRGFDDINWLPKV